MGKLGPSKRENALRVVKNREREKEREKERGFLLIPFYFSFVGAMNPELRILRLHHYGTPFRSVERQ
jgi:hypothetical protein